MEATQELEERKRLEAEFHDQSHREGHVGENKKWYSVNRASNTYLKGWIRRKCEGKQVLDFGCGNGETSLFAAECGATVVGIDISPVSVENAKRDAERRGLSDRTTFEVQDAEALTYEDASFDMAFEAGVLHHMDLDKAYSELARVLKPNGQVLCAEAIVHNPVFHAYRRRTPHLRTAWELEHILGVPEIKKAQQYFGKVDIRFFHLFSLLAVPLRNKRGFKPALRVLEAIDNIVLRIPYVQRMAWQAIFVLSEPKRPNSKTTANSGGS